jgi:predicted transcriptional regulator
MMSRGVAIPLFQRNVLVLQGGDSISRVMALIRQNNYSQFPMYRENELLGLLTEKGITHWLANNLAGRRNLDFLQHVKIQDVLEADEVRENYLFCNRNTPLDELLVSFARKPLVEAILITESGNRREKLLGIVSRWDILSYS